VAAEWCNELDFVPTLDQETSGNDEWRDVADVEARHEHDTGHGRERTPADADRDSTAVDPTAIVRGVMGTSLSRMHRRWASGSAGAADAPCGVGKGEQPLDGDLASAAPAHPDRTVVDPPERVVEAVKVLAGLS
jgi:hypothetical protein